MLPVFRKSLDQIKPEDVNALLEGGGFPENEVVEFKREVCQTERGTPSWEATPNGKMDLHRDGSNAIFKEVVAFANSYGGTVFIGIDETEDDPKRAKAIVGVEACAELAERLETAANDGIDPLLSSFAVFPVVTKPETGAGVVIIRVQRSHLLPHRVARTRHAFARRGSKSQPLSMRQIQDLTRLRDSEIERVEALFRDRHQAFSGWIRAALGSASSPVVGVRATAVPLNPIASTSSVLANSKLALHVINLELRVGTERGNALLPDQGGRQRPILRGLRSELGDPDMAIQFDALEHGLVELVFREVRPKERPHMPLVHVMGAITNVLRVVRNLRALSGLPDAEYALEVEIDRVWKEHTHPITGATVRDWRSLPSLELAHLVRDPYSHQILGAVGPLPLVLPRYPVGSVAEFDDVVTHVAKDIHNIAGLNYQSGPIVMELPS